MWRVGDISSAILHSIARKYAELLFFRIKIHYYCST